MIWGNISRSVNGENVLGGVAYKNKKVYLLQRLGSCQCAWGVMVFGTPDIKSLVILHIPGGYIMLEPLKFSTPGQGWRCILAVC